MAETESIRSNFQVDGNGPWVTFIHGIGSAIDGWDGVVAELSDRFRCLRYDLRGHGESPLPPLPYGLDEYVADLAALLDQQDVPTTHLVGHSLGGMIEIAEPLSRLGHLYHVRVDPRRRAAGVREIAGQEQAEIHRHLPGASHSAAPQGGLGRLKHRYKPWHKPWHRLWHSENFLENKYL